MSSLSVANKRKGRSAVTNGSRLFVSADASGPWGRRYRDLIQSYAEDAGGLGNLTGLKITLIRRAAALTVECERLEGLLAEGADVDTDRLGRLSGHLRRIAETIGLDKTVVTVKPPTVEEIAARHRREAAEGSE